MKESATQLCSTAPESHFLEKDTQEHRESAERVKSEPSAPFGVFRIFGKNSEDKNGTVRLAVVLILAVILLVQGLLEIHYGAKKSGFHIDEVFTFNSSMNMPTSWYNNKLFRDKWQSGDVYYRHMRVNPKKRFSYLIPYINQVKDVHPPLYYMAFHTICSIFPDVTWKWLGLSINFFFNLLSSVFLYFLAKEVSESDSFALFSTAFWAWSSGALSCAMFLRMYAMLTTWTILLALLHVRFLKSIDNDIPIGKNAWKGLLWTTVAGILTQYYFLVFCFFLCGFTFLYLFWQKKRNLAWRYAKTEFWGLAVSFFIFPFMCKHIFSGSRGKEAFHNFSGIAGWWPYLKKVADITYKEIFTWPILPAIILLILIFGVTAYLLRRKKTAPIGRNVAFFFLFLVALLFVVLIAKIAPYRVDRYYFCIYPFFVLSVLYVLHKTGSRVLSKKLLVPVFIAILVLELGVSFRGRYVNYLYGWGKERDEILSSYKKYPVIVTGDALQYLYEYEKFPHVFMCKSLKSLEKVKENGGDEYLKDGFLVYAVEFDKHSSEEKYMEEFSRHLPISKWEQISGSADDSVTPDISVTGATGERLQSRGGWPVYFCRTEAK